MLHPFSWVCVVIWIGLKDKSKFSLEVLCAESLNSSRKDMINNRKTTLIPANLRVSTEIEAASSCDL